MFIPPEWRNRLIVTLGMIAAVWIGSTVADGSTAPAFGAVALLLFLVTRWTQLPVGTLLLGAVTFGYIVGNRGFAQFSVTSTLPLLPAEAVLAVGGGWLCIQSAWRRESPVKREPLNLVLLLWIVLGTIRLCFDVRAHGFTALRDFATVYYATFFYLGQEAVRDPAGRKFLYGTLLVSCAVLLPISEIYYYFPSFFFNTFTVRGIPLIFYKGDLVGTFLAVGSVLFFLRFEAGGRRWNLFASVIFSAAVIATNNRASLLGLFVATAWLAVGRRWKFAIVQAGAGLLAVIVVFFGAAALGIRWEKTPVFSAYERALSFVDISGERAYRSDDSANKGDNNVFRRVWWEAVIDETVHGNPVVGLGFGYDLAERFVRDYYPDNSEEFSTRSPHNILLTIFARMGAIGLVVFLALMVIVARTTLLAVRAGPRAAALWCAVWVMFISACLGVVLEGPMGAVVFWTVLGMANGEEVGEEVPELAEEPANLRPLGAADEVPASL